MTFGRDGSDTPPWRVLQLIYSLPVGGAEDLMAAMITGLDARRFEVQAATIGPPGVVGQELLRAGYAVRSLGLDLKRTPFVRLVARVRDLLREVQPDHLPPPRHHAVLALPNEFNNRW